MCFLVKDVDLAEPSVQNPSTPIIIGELLLEINPPAFFIPKAKASHLSPTAVSSAKYVQFNLSRLVRSESSDSILAATCR